MKLKKILACAMAGAMVLGSMSSVFATTADEVTLTSTGWWTGVTGAELTSDSTSATWTYTILANEEISDFGIEVYDADGKYITTLTNGEGWYAGATGDALVIDGSSISASLVQGETYTVTVVRDGADFVITYSDSADTTLLTFTAANTDLAETASVHFYAQYGSFTVNASVEEPEESTTITADEVTLTSTGWWTGVTGAELTMDSTSATWTYTILANEEISDFGIEVYDADGKYITTLTNGEGWYAGATGDALVIDGSSISASLTQGETYTVTVVRDGADFVITYLDSTGTALLTFTAANTDLAETASVHFYAQYGSFTVNASATNAVDTGDSDDTTTGDSDDATTGDSDDTTTGDSDDTTSDADSSSADESSSSSDESTSSSDSTDEVVTITDELVGSGWWTDCQTSTAIALADGETISFTVDVTSDTLADGEYAAFCVEATDGTNYFTATSDGDCWGAGTDTDATSSGVVVGGSYTVTITRSGNNFTADIIDNATGESILSNVMYLEGTSEFGDTTAYIMSQVANLTVTYTSASDDDTTNTSSNSSSNSSTSNKTTSDASAAAPIVIALLGCAVVALASRKRMA